MYREKFRAFAWIPLVFNLTVLCLTPLALAWNCISLKIGAWSALYSLGFSLLCLLLFVLLTRTWRGFFLWNLPLLLLAPVFAWFMFTFGEPPDQNAMVTVMTTTGEESLGFIELFHLWPTVIAAVAILALYTLCALGVGGRPLPERLRKLYLWLSLPTLVLLLLMPVREDTGVMVDTNETLHLFLTSTYPFGGFVSIVGSTLGSLDAMGYFATKIPYHAVVSHPDAVPETDILVIGESAREDEFHLNGYGRQTSPHLDTINNLISYKRAYSTSNLTLYAVPMLVTGTQPARYQVRAIHGNIVDVANEAGFYTAWLSNQEVFLATIFHPKPALWKEPSDITGRGSVRSRPDGLLMPPFRTVVAGPEPRKFIVLHTYGSHWKYVQRLPDDGFKFSGSRARAQAALGTDQSNVAAQDLYDDTILYTDDILAQIIGAAQTLPGRVTVTYVSDHGEDIFLREGFGGHGFDSFYMAEAHIPLMFWANQRYIQDRPDIWQALRQRQNTTVSQDAVFYTLSSIMGVSFPGLDSSRDLTSPRFRPVDLTSLQMLTGINGKLAYVHNAQDWHGVPR